MIEKGDRAGKQAWGLVPVPTPSPIIPLAGLTVHPFIILLEVVAWSPTFSRGPKRKCMCYKLTMAGHHPWSPASWTLALHSPRTLSPPGSVPAPGPTACSSWAWSLESLVSLPMCQGSAVLRIVLFHIVGGEPANPAVDLPSPPALLPLLVKDLDNVALFEGQL